MSGQTDLIVRVLIAANRCSMPYDSPDGPRPTELDIRKWVAMHIASLRETGAVDKCWPPYGLIVEAFFADELILHQKP